MEEKFIVRFSEISMILNIPTLSHTPYICTVNLDKKDFYTVLEKIKENIYKEYLTGQLVFVNEEKKKFSPRIEKMTFLQSLTDDILKTNEEVSLTTNKMYLRKVPDSILKKIEQVLENNKEYYCDYIEDLISIKNRTEEMMTKISTKMR